MLAYVRHDESRRSLALVVLRFDDRPVRARIRLPAAVTQVPRWRDPITKGRPIVGRDSFIVLDLLSWDARILVPND